MKLGHDSRVLMRSMLRHDSRVWMRCIKKYQNGFGISCIMSYKKGHLHTLKHKMDLGMHAGAYGYIFIKRKKIHLRHV